MKTVKILGSGCKRCMATAEMAQTEARKLGVEIALEKVTDFAEIAGYGVARVVANQRRGTRSPRLPVRPDRSGALPNSTESRIHFADSLGITF